MASYRARVSGSRPDDTPFAVGDTVDWLDEATAESWVEQGILERVEEPTPTVSDDTTGTSSRTRSRRRRTTSSAPSEERDS